MSAYSLTAEPPLMKPHIVAQAAKDRLRANPHWPVRRVSCECDQGRLFLRGHLSCFFHKQLAQEAVADVDGVTQVINEIEVIRPNRQPERPVQF
jgi:osmotically-inducible protein OsmY